MLIILASSGQEDTFKVADSCHFMAGVDSDTSDNPATKSMLSWLQVSGLVSDPVFQIKDHL